MKYGSHRPNNGNEQKKKACFSHIFVKFALLYWFLELFNSSESKTRQTFKTLNENIDPFLTHTRTFSDFEATLFFTRSADRAGRESYYRTLKDRKCSFEIASIRMLTAASIEPSRTMV